MVDKMSKLVKVKLNMDESEVKNYMYIVAGKESEDIDDYGVSIFYNGAYVLNFVLNEDDYELLTSEMKVKCVKDLGFSLYTYGYCTSIFKHRKWVGIDDNALLNRIDDVLDCSQVNGSSAIIDELQIVSENYDAFARALRVALLNPVVGQRLYTEVPFTYDEIEEF